MYPQFFKIRDDGQDLGFGRFRITMSRRSGGSLNGLLKKNREVTKWD
jgi:hypothetical protein